MNKLKQTLTILMLLIGNFLGHTQETIFNQKLELTQCNSPIEFTMNGRLFESPLTSTQTTLNLLLTFDDLEASELNDLNYLQFECHGSVDGIVPAEIDTKLCNTNTNISLYPIGISNSLACKFRVTIHNPSTTIQQSSNGCYFLIIGGTGEYDCDSDSVSYPRSTDCMKEILTIDVVNHHSDFSENTDCLNFDLEFCNPVLELNDGENCSFTTTSTTLTIGECEGGGEGDNEEAEEMIVNSKVLNNLSSSYFNEELTIFPNPVSNEIRINNIIGIESNLIIIDLNGKEWYQQANVNEGSLVLSVATWPRGIYIIQLQNQNQFITKKVIIQ